MSLKRHLVLPRPSNAPFLLLVALAGVVLACGPLVGGNGGTTARIASSDVYTWDPAQQGDAGTASVLAQVFEGLTAFDADSNVQPALAQSWKGDENGRQLTFTLRPDLAYSDGTPMAAQDVVDSWLRLIDPARPSPLSSLLNDVQGATDYQAGRAGRDGVGLRAVGDTIEVDLRRPATFFLAVTASPSLAVVPPSMAQSLTGPPTVVSGAYLPSVPSDGLIHLTANSHYWASTPAVTGIDLVTDTGGTSGASLFDSGDLDYTAVGAADASWIAYDARLGPQLRAIDDFGVSFYGFTTTVKPFDDANVRRAFAEAVDWDRLVTLTEATPATSMVPAGIPGRDETDHSPRYDPDDARALLAAAGYPGGANLPPITILTYGVGWEQAAAKQLADNLGAKVTVEAVDFEGALQAISAAQDPSIWTLSWIADYPHPHDFLGLLLESDSTSNYGKWSNADYDRLLEAAAATADPAQQQVLYGEAQDILAREVPVIPIAYSRSWALSRDGLLGANVSGVGLIRYAALAWAPGSGR